MKRIHDPSGSSRSVVSQTILFGVTPSYGMLLKSCFASSRACAIHFGSGVMDFGKCGAWALLTTVFFGIQTGAAFVARGLAWSSEFAEPGGAEQSQLR